MKAKWLWMTLAHVSVVLVIALAVMWISFADIFLLPKFEKLLHDGIIDPAFIDGDVSWMPAFLNGVREAFAHSTTWLLLLAIAAVALFEWRVKSENKPWIRLSVLGTAAVGLTVLGVLMAGSLVICFCLGVPAMSRMTRPFAVEQVASIDKSVSALEEALAKKDWKAMREPATEASNALSRLANGPAVISLTRWSAPPTVDDLRGNLKAAQEDFRAAEQAICDQDAGRLETELQKFRKSFEPLRVAAKRPGR